VRRLFGSYEAPGPGAPLARHDEFLLWLKGKKAEGYDVDREIAAAELDRAFTVWMRDPNKDESEDFDALTARLKAEIAAKAAA